MKKFYIEIIPYDRNIATVALESGADAVVVKKGDSKKVKEIGLIQTISEGEDFERYRIKNKNDICEIAKISKNKTVIVSTTDWTIIPLENLVAQASNIIMEVKNSEEAKTALQILEKGVDGVLLKTYDLNEIKKTAKIIKEKPEKIKIVKAKIESIRPIGMGDRVCIDTVANMAIGEGMLIGNYSPGMFLVHSESEENPYVAARPFRVNAGAVHAYVLTSGGKTKYLSELKSGDEVLVVDTKGRSKISYVGRVKIEKRHLLLVSAEYKDEEISIVMQNAETIKLLKYHDGKAITTSVIKLKPGNGILAYVQSAGRHFGMKIEETIVVK